MTSDLRGLRGKLRDDAQLQRVRDVVHFRLADDRIQDECRYLMRFWWQLVMSYHEVSRVELKHYVTAAKLAIVWQLLAAVDNGHEAIDRWIEDCEASLPIVEDRGFAVDWTVE